MGDPRHQGGEGVAGTPGACSQVFCHPIRCMRCAFLSTETCSLHEARTTPTTQSTQVKGNHNNSVWALISFVSSGRAMECERVGAAKRRRERRLRSWAKHERMTVAMALAENLHHSRQKVEGGEHDGLRAQKTVRAAGARPGVLTEPEPQGGAVTVGYVAAPDLLLEVALMAGGDSVDGTALRFLVKKAL